MTSGPSFITGSPLALHGSCSMSKSSMSPAGPSYCPPEALDGLLRGVAQRALRAPGREAGFPRRLPHRLLLHHLPPPAAHAGGRGHIPVVLQERQHLGGMREKGNERRVSAAAAEATAAAAAAQTLQSSGASDRMFAHGSVRWRLQNLAFTAQAVGRAWTMSTRSLLSSGGIVLVARHTRPSHRPSRCLNLAG